MKNKDGKLVWPEAHDYKKGKCRFKSDLIPAAILLDRYFAAERDAIEALEGELAALEQQLDEMREEHGGGRKDCSRRSSMARGKSRKSPPRR